MMPDAILAWSGSAQSNVPEPTIEDAGKALMVDDQGAYILMPMVKVQGSKVVTPSIEQQVIYPDDGYNSFQSIVINAIPYVEYTNEANGKTVEIG